MVRWTSGLKFKPFYFFSLVTNGGLVYGTKSRVSLYDASVVQLSLDQLRKVSPRLWRAEKDGELSRAESVSYGGHSSETQLTVASQNNTCVLQHPLLRKGCLEVTD